MQITLKKYRKNNFKELDQCMIELQNFLIDIDPLKRIRKGPNYSPEYAKNVIEKVKKYSGAIFLAYDNKQLIGCIAGIVERQSKKNLLECIPTKAGRIIELFVSEKYRNSGIGKQLMEDMEEYLRDKKCDVIRIEVFEPNQNAHHFYRKGGYKDRVIDMIKVLK